VLESRVVVFVAEMERRESKKGSFDKVVRIQR